MTVKITEEQKKVNRERQRRKVENLAFMSGMSKAEISLEIGYLSPSNFYNCINNRGFPKGKEIIIDKLIEIEHLKYQLHRDGKNGRPKI